MNIRLLVALLADGHLLVEGAPGLAKTRAMTFQRAALLARDDNYLAANELGVLLTAAGHYEQATLLFHQVLAAEPNPVTQRNLAFVLRQLGDHLAADAHEHDARCLAQGMSRMVSPAGIVEWVEPQTLTTGATPPTPQVDTSQALAQPHPPQRPVQRFSPWKQIWREAQAWVNGPVRVAQRPPRPTAPRPAQPPAVWP